MTAGAAAEFEPEPVAVVRNDRKRERDPKQAASEHPRLDRRQIGFEFVAVEAREPSRFIEWHIALK